MYAFLLILVHLLNQFPFWPCPTLLHALLYTRLTIFSALEFTATPLTIHMVNYIQQVYCIISSIASAQSAVKQKQMASMAEADEYGGYEYDFVGNLDKKFYCLVCQKVLRDPVLTGCCGQHYCDSCLQQWKRTNYENSCPHCRKVNYKSLIDKPLQREINDLKVYCPHRSLGCRWSAQLTTLPSHLESEKDGCAYVKVKCTLKCGETVDRGKLTKHLHYNCPQRPFECGYCGKEDTYTKITGETKITGLKDKIPKEMGHYAECPEYMKPCPNGCGKTMKRKEITEHKKQCHREPVMCTFRGMNTGSCGEKMLRSELPNHQKICPFRPFKCKFCNKEGTYTAITGEKQCKPNTKQPRIPPEQGHYAECPNYPLVCKNKCQPAEIKRCDMKLHLTECPLQLVPCPVKEAGCQDMLKRKDINHHLASNQAQHLALLCSAYTETKTELATVKTQLEKAQAELNSTNAELKATKAELSNLKKGSKEPGTELDTVKKKAAETERKLQNMQRSSLNTERELAGIKKDLAMLKTSSTRTEKARTLPLEETSEPRRRNRWWRK